MRKIVNEIVACSTNTPLGTLTLAARNKGLMMAKFGEPEHVSFPSSFQLRIVSNETVSNHNSSGTRAEAHLADATASLKEYFSGNLAAPHRITICPQGTEFQQLVWKALHRIPAGSTRSYSELAMSVGRPEGARAVGTACRLNPLLLFVPCHRIIAKNRKLTGFNGGVEKKAYLLEHEGLQVAGAEAAAHAHSAVAA